MDHDLWYVAYGSNLAAARFRCYIEGGRPVGAHRTLPGCRDRTLPRDWRAVQMPGVVYFALESPTWGGGMAFYDPTAAGTVRARAWLVTADQFSDIVDQEMHRELGIGFDVADVAPGTRLVLGPGRYETIVHVGDLDGRPMATFTCPWRGDEVEHRPPSEAYLAMIEAGRDEIAGAPVFAAQSTSAE